LMFSEEEENGWRQHWAGLSGKDNLAATADFTA
jgi:hypothetical protein